MKITYDEGRQPISLEPDQEVYIKLAHDTDHGYKLLQNQTKLSFIKAKPYKILEKIGPLSYKLELPNWIDIHSVISIKHLEPVIEDPFQRPQPKPGLVHDNEGNEKYIIKKILRKEFKKKSKDYTKRLYYEVKYLSYNITSWKLATILKENVPNLINKFERSLS